MENIEIITFWGVLITFFTTVVGWIVTNRTQHSILDKQIKSQREISLLKEKLAFRRDQKQFVISDTASFLKELEAWFEKGRKIYLDAVTISPIEIPKINVEPKSLPGCGSPTMS